MAAQRRTTGPLLSCFGVPRRDAAHFVRGSEAGPQGGIRIFSGRTSLDRKIDTFESQVLTFGASVQCSVSKDGCSSASSQATLWPAQKSS